MRNAGFLENTAGRFESFTRIERHRGDLRIDDHGRVASFTSDPDQRLHQRSADAMVPPGTNDSDAADVTVREQTRTADRLAPGLRKRMDRDEVCVVPFEHLGDALLDNEHVVAYAAQRSGR